MFISSVPQRSMGGFYLFIQTLLIPMLPTCSLHFTPTVRVSSHNANVSEVTALRAWEIRPLLSLLCSRGCLLCLSCSPALPHLTEAIPKWKMCVYTFEDGRKSSSLGDYDISSSTPSKDSQVLDPGIQDSKFWNLPEPSLCIQIEPFTLPSFWHIGLDLPLHPTKPLLSPSREPSSHTSNLNKLKYCTVLKVLHM